jgi:holin-like protein
MIAQLHFSMQLAWLVAIAAAARAISAWLPFQVPSGVIGMVALFVLLQSRLLKPCAVERAAAFLVRHLAFFFVPIAIGLMALADTLMPSAHRLLAVLAASAALGIVVSAYVTALLSRRRAQP